EAAAEASGDVLFYDSFSDADDDIEGMTEGQVVEIFADETKGGHRTRYRSESSTLVYKITLDLLAGNTFSVIDYIMRQAGGWAELAKIKQGDIDSQDADIITAGIQSA